MRKLIDVVQTIIDVINTMTFRDKESLTLLNTSAIYFLLLLNNIPRHTNIINH